MTRENKIDGPLVAEPLERRARCLSSANLEGANLANAILTDARIDGAKFDAAIMPDGRRAEFQSPLPDDLQLVLDELQKRET